jgi:serine O-acetyltransferase
MSTKNIIKLSLGRDDLLRYVIAQCSNFFPDTRPSADEGLVPSLDDALMRLEYCFTHIKRKYFFDGETHLFSHLQSDQYAMFLYFFSRSIFRLKGKHPFADKVYYLNKVLHSIDVYYEVELPEIFLFRHSIGTVLGRAKYTNYFTVGQNCTVGNNRGAYPVFSEQCALYSGSSVVGDCTIGRNVHIAARSFIRNTAVPDNSLVIGQSPDLNIQPTQASVFDSFFDSFRRVPMPGDD